MRGFVHAAARALLTLTGLLALGAALAACEGLFPSGDTALAELTVDGVPVPGLSPGRVTYETTVLNTTARVTLGATPRHALAAVENLGSLDLSPGWTVARFRVVAENGRGQPYTLSVYRQTPQESANALLASLSLAEASLSPAFRSDLFTYTVQVLPEVAQVTVQAQAQESLSPVEGTGPRSLQAGENTLPVTVTSPNGQHQRTYTLRVYRLLPEESPVAELTALSVSAGTLVPPFDPALTAYEILLGAYDPEDLTLSATAREPEFASVANAGPVTVPRSDTDPVTLERTVTVTSPDGENQRAYTLTFRRPARQAQSALAVHEERLYVVGGRRRDGSLSAEVWFAPLSGLGNPGAWVRSTDLPSPRAEALFFVYGPLAFVAGGLGPEGPAATIWTGSYDSATGQLGFSRSEGLYWGTNSRMALPQGRAGMDLQWDGVRLTLTGGRNALDAVPEPWTAQVWLDGQWGPWYYGAAYLSAASRPWPGLGRDRVTVGPTRYRLDPTWSGDSAADGPPRILVETDDQPRDAPPIAWPRAGFVRTNTVPRLQVPGAAASTLRFERGWPVQKHPDDPPAGGDPPADPSAGSALWVPGSTGYRMSVSTPNFWAWGNFADPGAPSLSRASYDIFTGSSFPLIQASLSPGSTWYEGFMGERYSTGAVSPQTWVLIRLWVHTPGRHRLTWADSASSRLDPQGQAYTAQVQILAAEAYQGAPTVALDRFGQPIVGRRSSDQDFFEGDWDRWANAPGEYHLWLRQTGGPELGTFALRWERLP